MKVERLQGRRCGPPFPIYGDPVGALLAAHQSGASGRDPTVAHILALCAGYAYAEIDTMAMMMSRVGFAEQTTVRICETVDAMYIDSTAYLVQSACGRVAILSYRGTQPANLVNWLGDADIGSDTMLYGAGKVGVHSGFYRNFRATRLAVIEELSASLKTLEALYVTGHSLGGALAVLFALSIAATGEQRAIAERLRAVYTFAQPMTVGQPLPTPSLEMSRKIFRHVLPRDIVPALPPKGWGNFAHIGREYRCEGGEWQLQATAITQLRAVGEIPRALLSMLGPVKRRAASPYTLADHGPHHYLSAVRPNGLVTEFGDQG